MATTKLTARRGDREEKAVVIGAGAAEAQTDTMSLNIDYTNIRRGEALMMLKAIQMRIEGSPTWPPT
jgi:hypothetical protein